jgi:hypothetical protein
MKKLLVIFILILNIFFCYSQVRKDTIKIINNNGSYKLHKVKIDTSSFTWKSLVVLNEYDSIIKTTTFIPYQIDFNKNEIIIPLNNFTIHKASEEFFIKYFPYATKSLDSLWYNKIDLGYIKGRLNSKGELYFKTYLKNNSKFTYQDEIRTQKEFKELKKLDWNCSEVEFNQAYELFNKMTWLIILRNSFTKEEFFQLKEMAMCLGPEIAGEFFPAYDLINFIKK